MAEPVTIPPVVLGAGAEGTGTRQGTEVDQPPTPLPEDAAAQRQPALLAPIPIGKVPVLDRTGTVVLVDARDVDRARTEGMRLASPQEVRAQQREQIYGDVSGKLATGALNAFDAISMNFGKGLLVEGAGVIGGPEAAERLRRGIELSDEENPGSRMIGTGLGIAAPLLSGAGALTPAALVESGAAALTEGVPSMVGRMALRGGAEAAVFGAGDAFSGAELADEEVTSEKLFAGAYKGFLLGAGLGAGLGVAGKVVGKMTDALPAAGARGLAERLAADAQGLSAKEIRQLEELGIDAQRRGSFALDEPEVRKVLARAGSRADMAKAARGVVERTGREVGDAVDAIEVEAQKLGRRPDVREMLRRAEKEVAAPLDRVPGLDASARKVRAYLTDYGLKTGVLERLPDGSVVETGLTGKASFKDVHHFRTVLDDLVFTDAGGVREGSRAAKEITRSMRNMQEQLFREQARGVAPEAVARYEGAARRYHVAAKLAPKMEAAASRAEAKSLVGLLDTLAAVGGTVALGPKGALLAFASKAVRERGPQFTAHVLDRAGRLAVYKQAALEVDDQLARAAQDMVSTRAPKATTVVKTRVARLRKEADHVDHIAKAPEAVVAAAGDHVAHEAAPTVRARYLGLVTRAAVYLAAHRPRGTDLAPGTPGLYRAEPSHEEWAAWGRRRDVVEDPVGAIRAAVKRGNLTQEHLETLDQLFPRLGQEVRRVTLLEYSAAVARGKVPPYAQRVQLSFLTGVPLDATLTATFVETQQKAALRPTAQMESLYDRPKDMGTTDQGPRAQKQRRARMLSGGGEDSLEVAGGR